jgi:hypothetical protein
VWLCPRHRDVSAANAVIDVVSLAPNSNMDDYADSVHACWVDPYVGLRSMPASTYFDAERTRSQ